MQSFIIRYTMDNLGMEMGSAAANGGQRSNIEHRPSTVDSEEQLLQRDLEEHFSAPIQGVLEGIGAHKDCLKS